MVGLPKFVDLDDSPDLVSLVAEVRDTGEEVVIRQSGEEIAIMRPIRPRPLKSLERTITEADVEASLSAAGSWKHIDTDQLIEDIYANRDHPLTHGYPAKHLVDPD